MSHRGVGKADAVRRGRAGRLGLALGLSALALGVGPAGALASTASVANGVLRYDALADGGAANAVTFSGAASMTVSDSLPITPAPDAGCTATGPNSVSCTGVSSVTALAGPGNDNVTLTTTLNSSISGSSGDDTLNGDGGADVITGGEGVDRVNSGDGNDLILIDGEFSDFANCGAGDRDRVRADQSDIVDANCERVERTGVPAQPAGTNPGGAGGGAATGGVPTQVFPTALRPGACQVRRDLTTGNDTFTGTAQGDLINALAGDDIVNGVAGDDCLFGFEGKDRLSGAEGNDFLKGAEGDDGLNGGSGDDGFAGDAGNDRMVGDAGRDRMAGGDGRDSVRGGTGSDTLSGGAGNDVMSGEANNDRISGDAGNDLITAGAGRNSLFGGAGNDRINAANGQRDRVNCGSGRRDTVRADRADRVSGCERIQRLRR